MKKISFRRVIDRLRKINFKQFDLIVAIGKGGIIPAGLIRNILDVDMEILWLNFRDSKNKIKFSTPKLTKKFKNIKNKEILIVDDVSRTGATLKEAKKILKGNKVKTFVLNGKADYNILSSKECVRFPWN